MRLPVSACALVICAVLLVIYRGSFDNGFHYDDFHSIVDNPHIRDLRNIPAFFVRPEMFSLRPERAMYRPLVLLSYAGNYALAGYDAFGYHVLNLFLHMLCVGLVYVVGLLMGWTALASGLAALIFAVHPLQTETVNYVSSRSESLAAIGYLSALVAFLYWRRNTQVNCGAYLFSLAALSGALLAKSIAVTFPVVLLIAERGWARRCGWAPRSHIGVAHLGYWVIVGSYLALTSGAVIGALNAPVRPLVQQILTQLKALVYYVFTGGMPVNLSVEHGFVVARSVFEPAVWLPLCLVMSVAAMVCTGWRRGRNWLLMAAVIVLAPASIVPLHVLVNEHRLYLSMVFWGLFMGAFLIGVGFRGRWLACLTWLTLLAILSHQRTGIWRDEITLWQNATARAPGMYRAHMHLGGAIEKRYRSGQALEHYRRAVELAPDISEAHYNLGNALRDLGRIQEAREAYEKSLVLHPDFVEPLVNLAGLRFYEFGDSTGAMELYQHALNVGAESRVVYANLGQLLRRFGRLGEAAAVYERGLTVFPGEVNFHFGMAVVRDGQGQTASAVGHYRRFLRLATEPSPLIDFSFARVAALEGSGP